MALSLQLRLLMKIIALWIALSFALAASAEEISLSCSLLVGTLDGAKVKYDRILETTKPFETDKVAPAQRSGDNTIPSCNTEKGPYPGYDLSVCRDEKGELYFLTQLNDFGGLNIQHNFDTNKRGAHSRIVLSSAHPKLEQDSVVVAYSECFAR